MHYEKAYQEALERAKNLRKDAIDMGENICAKQCEIIFPELADSEDERIRKALIRFHKSTIDVDGIKGEDIIAWLEKQGEPNPYSGTSFKYNGHTWGMCARDGGVEILVDGKIKERVFLGNKPQGKTALEATKEEKVDNQNCVKPTDKVEPKFNVGDWVVNNNSEGVCQVTEIKGDEYCIWPLYDEMQGYLRIIDVDNDFHLWSIQDAKDGDVLYCKGENEIEYFVMNKGINKHDNIDSYFRYNSLNDFGVDIPSVLSSKNDNITPATKEQRDFLFQKMKEAGYEWDADKKELKKIDNRFDYEHANIQQKDFASKATTANRQVYNRAILKILSNYVEKYPDIRFGQMLCNLGIGPVFNEESQEIYLKLNETINKQK